MKNNLPFFTIITPTFNRKKLLENTILSVLHQKKDIPFEWEHIIVDDGSTDGTEEYIRKYLIENTNVSYTYQQNSGVWKARNTGINAMNPKSDYVLFLDSDDTIAWDLFSRCLLEWERLHKEEQYRDTVGIICFYETDTWDFVGNTDFFHGEKALLFTYQMYLENTMNWDKLVLWKSNIYQENSEFRFSEEVINELILWSKIMQYTYKNNAHLLYINFVGWYRGTNNSDNTNKITKTISKERFQNNALWNEQVLEIIWTDLLNFWYTKSYADYLFRIGINWVLYGEKYKWLQFIQKSLQYHFDLKIFGIYILSFCSRKIILFIYKLYI